MTLTPLRRAISASMSTSRPQSAGMASTTVRRPSGLDRGQLGDGLVHVGQLEVGEQLDGTATVDDEMLVGVDDAQLVWADVPEDGSGEGHAGPPLRLGQVRRPMTRGRHRRQPA